MVSWHHVRRSPRSGSRRCMVYHSDLGRAHARTLHPIWGSFGGHVQMLRRNRAPASLRVLERSGFPMSILSAYERFMESLIVRNAVAGGLGQPYSRSCSITQGCPFSVTFVSLLLRPWLLVRSLHGIPRALADDLSAWTSGVRHVLDVRHCLLYPRHRRADLRSQNVHLLDVKGGQKLVASSCLADAWQISSFKKPFPRFRGAHHNSRSYCQPNVGFAHEDVSSLVIPLKVWLVHTTRPHLGVQGQGAPQGLLWMRKRPSSCSFCFCSSCCCRRHVCSPLPGHITPPLFPPPFRRTTSTLTSFRFTGDSRYYAALSQDDHSFVNILLNSYPAVAPPLEALERRDFKCALLKRGSIAALLQAILFHGAFITCDLRLHVHGRPLVCILTYFLCAFRGHIRSLLFAARDQSVANRRPAIVGLYRFDRNQLDELLAKSPPQEQGLLKHIASAGARCNMQMHKAGQVSSPACAWRGAIEKSVEHVP